MKKIPVVFLSLSVLFAAIFLAARTRPLPAQDFVENPARSFLLSIRVGSPESYQGLVLFPLYSGNPDPHHYLTLPEALAKGEVEIHEWDGGEVNQIALRNDSDWYVFGMSGEILEGAKQDRILQQDLLLPPTSGFIPVSDFCTEAGRWTPGATSFGSSRKVVPYATRKAAAISGSQQEVWGSVNREEQKLNVPSPTQAARDIYNAPKVRAGIAPYEKALKSFPYREKGSVGVAAFSNGNLLVVDLFQSPDVFQRLYPELLDSYAVDALDSTVQGSWSRWDVENMLKSVASHAVFTRRANPGAGEVTSLSASHYDGSALVFKGHVLHLDLFPGEEEIKSQEPRPEFNLDVRRENHGR